jgi:hypothetical protein
MSIFNTIKRLAFADKGAALLQSTLIPYTFSQFNSKNTAVAVWDLNSYSLRFTCPGILIGKSQDGTTFSTHYPPHTDKPERADIAIRPRLDIRSLDRIVNIFNLIVLSA